MRKVRCKVPDNVQRRPCARVHKMRAPYPVAAALRTGCPVPHRCAVPARENQRQPVVDQPRVRPLQPPNSGLRRRLDAGCFVLRSRYQRRERRRERKRVDRLVGDFGYQPLWPPFRGLWLWRLPQNGCRVIIRHHRHPSVPGAAAWLALLLLLPLLLLGPLPRVHRRRIGWRRHNHYAAVVHVCALLCFVATIPHPQVEHRRWPQAARQPIRSRRTPLAYPVLGAPRHQPLLQPPQPLPQRRPRRVPGLPALHCTASHRVAPRAQQPWKRVH
ncbi:hypothetical protein BX070DRAFT_223988 [Coemansia spiralis]|nr:hypothetical protein BX070DRAFT_223988 [Coemansia spiralis]